MSARYSRNSKVEAAPMRDECVLFNPQNNKFCLLNRTASLLWGKLDAPKSAEELAAELETHFDGVLRDQAVKDVESAFQELVATGCVVAAQGS